MKRMFWLLVAVLIFRQFQLLEYYEWGDESETIVAAKMIVSGKRLYSEIFNHHGPLTFLPGVLLECLNEARIQGHRFLLMIFQWVAIIALIRSPLVKGPKSSLVMGFGALALFTLCLPSRFGQMYQYQAYAGLFLLVALAQYVLPGITGGSLSRFQVALGNFLIACLPFFAITYLPGSLLLFFTAIKTGYRRLSFAWFLIAIVFNLAFVLIIGSLPGYFVNHFFMNFVILPKYSDFHAGRAIKDLILFFTGSPAAFVLAVSLLGLIPLVRGLNSRVPGFRVMMLMGAMLSFLIRGDSWQGLGFWYGLVAFPLLLGPLIESVDWRSIRVFIVPLGILVFLTFLLTNKNVSQGRIQKSTDFSRFVGILTEKNDPIIAWPFSNYLYIDSERLPASGSFFLLPWQEEMRSLGPKLGILFDHCSDIKLNRPKIMFLDRWKVWDKFDWTTYGQCVDQILKTNYIQVLNRPWYVRKDVFEKFKGTIERFK